MSTNLNRYLERESSKRFLKEQCELGRVKIEETIYYTEKLNLTEEEADYIFEIFGLSAKEREARAKKKLDKTQKERDKFGKKATSALDDITGKAQAGIKRKQLQKEIDVLEKQMVTAIANENKEKATELAHKIRGLEAKKSGVRTSDFTIGKAIKNKEKLEKKASTRTVAASRLILKAFTQNVINEIKSRLEDMNREAKNARTVEEIDDIFSRINVILISTAQTYRNNMDSILSGEYGGTTSSNSTQDDFDSASADYDFDASSFTGK